MIQGFALSCVRSAAEAAGMPEDRIMPLSVADNLTLPRPRIEFQVLPAKYRRTGRILGILRGTRDTPVQRVKRELYAVDLTLVLNIMAPDTGADATAAEQWLTAFEQVFIPALPRGGNDAAGNYVRLAVQKASRSRPPDTRIGVSDIRVFTKFSVTFVISCSGRITEEIPQRLIADATINIPTLGK